MIKFLLPTSLYDAWETGIFRRGRGIISCPGLKLTSLSPADYNNYTGTQFINVNYHACSDIFYLPIPLCYTVTP